MRNMNLFTRAPGFFLVVICFYSNSAFAQLDKDDKEMILEAESYFLFEEFKDAMPLYQQLRIKDPDNANLNYKIGRCYLEDRYQKKKSISYLETAVNHINESYKMNSFRERNAPPEALFYLGNAYRINNQLKKAIEVYEEFKEMVDPEVYDIELVDKEIQSCQRAIKAKKSPIFYIAKNMGEVVNSRFAETNPIISGDGRSLVFTSKLQFYDAVFYSKKDENGNWSYPLNLTPYFALDGNSYSTGISYDGDEIYVYRSDEFDGNIYVSKLIEGTWSRLEKLNDNINTKFWESHASVSADGKMLYFTSNRDNGYGGLDIYTSIRDNKNNNNKWGTAKNLGPLVNSKYNEDTPFATADGNVLYFSSFGHDNIGGYDIFYSVKKENGDWSQPKNIGYPLNTTDDDLFFVPFGDGSSAVYAMFDRGNTTGLTDIYELEVFFDLHPRKFVISGTTILDEDDAKQERDKWIARLYDEETNKMVDEARLDKKGKYQLDASSGRYRLVIEGEGIASSQQEIHLPVDHPGNEVQNEPITVVPSAVEEAGPLLAPVTPREQPPLLKANREYFRISDKDDLQIRLNVESQSDLLVETYIDNQLKKTEQFETTRKRFFYDFDPEPGQNLLKFTITDQKGNTNSLDVIVDFIPEIKEETDESEIVMTGDTDENLIYLLLPAATGELSVYLKELIDAGTEIEPGELYSLLISEAGKRSYDPEEVNMLFIRALSQKATEDFIKEMHQLSSPSLAIVLDTIEQRINDYDRAGSVIKQLRTETDRQYSDEEIRLALLNMAVDTNRSSLWLEMMKQYADSKVRSKLSDIDMSTVRDYSDTQILRLLFQDLEEEELWQLLSDAASSEALMPYYFNLYFAASGNVREALSDIDFEGDSVFTAFGLTHHLLEKSQDYGYTKNDIIDHISRAKKESRRNLQIFTSVLAREATGSLKNYLTNLDPEKENIPHFTGLLDHIMQQSKFRDYSIENFYLLLTGMIEFENMDGFISQMTEFASGDLKRLLQRLDSYSFSTPVELIKYLFSQENKYDYTANDINDLLLRMILESGIYLKDSGTELLFKARTKAERNKLIISLVVANLLLILVLVFILARKKKNTKNDNPNT